MATDWSLGDELREAHQYNNNRVERTTVASGRELSENVCSQWFNVWRALRCLENERQESIPPLRETTTYVYIVVSMCCHRGVSYLKARLRGLPLGVK